VKYLCGERAVPVNNVPADEGAWTNDLPSGTPLGGALFRTREEVALYLLSLPRGEDSPPLEINKPIDGCSSPFLVVAAVKGMARVVEALLGLGADLLARDARGHLAVCRAVQNGHVDVVNVLLAAHAKQARGAKAVLECPCPQYRDAGYSLLFHALENTKTIQDRLAMVRCLVEKWGENVRALITSDYGDEHYPLFIAVLSTYHNVVAFFLDECGMDVNSTTPCAKDTVLHVLVRFRPTSRRVAVRMLKYLVEEKGADIHLRNADGLCAWDLIRQTNNITFFNYLISVRDGVPLSVDDVLPHQMNGNRRKKRRRP
jgi:ankyrin repeat protein